MKKRCKPGDLAIVIRDPPLPDIHLAGHIVTVLRLAPTHNFRLPCGTLHAGMRPGSWVVEFPRQTLFPLANGHRRLGVFGCLPDSVLAPLRPDDGLDESELELRRLAELEA